MRKRHGTGIGAKVAMAGAALAAALVSAGGIAGGAGAATSIRHPG